jgi:hypothetical protein
MRKFLLGAAAVASATLFAAPAMAASVVTNGGFETGDFTGWNTTGNLGVYSNVGNAAVPTDWGTYRVASLGTTTLSQTLSTIAGTVYRIAYSIESDAGPGTVAVNFGSATPNTGGTNTTTGRDDFATHFFFATATSASTVLSVQLSNGSYFNLDNISVTAVPEAGTWAMLMIGFGAAGVSLRTRRRSAKVAFA